jgi:hypothetical protein
LGDLAVQHSGGQAKQQDLMNSKHRDYSVASGGSEFAELMGGGKTESSCFDWS